MNRTSTVSYNSCCEYSTEINGFSRDSNSTYGADSKLFDLPFEFVLFFVIFNIIVLILTVLGNAAVIYVFVASDVMRNTVNNHFLVSLSIADMLVGLLVMPCAIDALYSNEWRCGGFWKDFSGFGNFCFCISSIMHLMMLSVDRYLAISRPLLYPTNITTNRALVIVFILWFYSTLWALPPLFGLSSYECFIAYIGKCHEDDWSRYGLNLVFGLSVVSCTYGLALVTMVYVYWKIGKTIRKQASRIAAMNTVGKIGSVKKKNSEQRNLLTRNKGVVTLLVVIVTYLACWSPFCVLLFIELGQGKKVQGPASLVTMFVGFLNSCCNPIIYSIKYQRFRIVLVRLIKKNYVLSNVTAFTVSDVPPEVTVRYNKALKT